MAWLNGHCVGPANDTLAFVRGRPGRSVTSAPHKCLSVPMFREGFRPWWEKGIENKQLLFFSLSPFFFFFSCREPQSQRRVHPEKEYKAFKITFITFCIIVSFLFFKAKKKTIFI